MAIPWLSALKAIPWGNVIEHAPNVLDKARDLIDKHRKTAEPETVDSKQHTASDLPRPRKKKKLKWEKKNHPKRGRKLSNVNKVKKKTNKSNNR